MAKTKLLRSLLLSMAIAAVIDGGAVEGKWRGKLELGQTKLDLIFNFKSEGNEISKCTMDVPMQGANGIPVEVAYCNGDSLSLLIKQIGASFSGIITDDKITGEFSQRGFTFPLTLKPDTDLSERRPQTPRAPFPYTSIDTTFIAKDGTLLAGTLVIPTTADSRKMPVVVMVSGSGPQNRDEEIFEHRPFAVIADYLARNGIASLRYDDRGMFESKGDFSSSVFDTFKDDAESALEFVGTFPQFGNKGIIGHSEGGTIALKLASENLPDFVVSLAGMAVSGKECIMKQNERSLGRLGIDDIEKEESLQLISACFDSIITGNNGIPFDVDAYIRENDLGVPQHVVASVKSNHNAGNEWFGSLLRLNPRDWLAGIKKPVLAINGTLDTQVDADSNLATIKEYVGSAEVKSYPGLNHLMQHASTGEIAEYGEIKETISPEVLQDIVSFIKSL